MYGISADQIFGLGGDFLTFGQSPTLQIRSPMYYTGGFLPAGAGQTSGFGGGGILGAVTSGLQTFLPTLFQQRPSGGFGQVPAPVPPTQTVPPTHPVIGAAGNSGGTMGGTALVAGRAHMARYAPAGTRGYHPPKHPSACSRVPAGMWVRNRHRNVANIHALRRSISRLHGFERICRKVVHFVSPHKRGRPVFRRRRKRS